MGVSTIPPASDRQGTKHYPLVSPAAKRASEIALGSRVTCAHLVGEVEIGSAMRKSLRDEMLEMQSMLT